VPRDRGLVAIVATLLVFACSFPALKASVDGLGIGTSAALRMTGGGLPLLLLARNQLGAARPVARRCLLVGGFLLGIQTLCINVGVDAASASLGALVLGLEPVGIAVVAVTLGGERATPALAAAVGFGLVGVVVLSGAVTTGIARSPIGAVAALMGTVVTFSLYTIAIKELTEQAPPLAVSALVTLGAACLALPVAAFEALQGTAVHGAGWAAIGGTAYLAIGSQVIAFPLWSFALERLPASVVGAALFCLPVLGALVSAAVLGESLHARDAVGGMLVLVAMALASRARRAPVGPSAAV
jgi:drug/metabolite transporter (DMT)-like permease